MEGRAVLTWSVENWITVLLMVALGYGLFILVDQFAIQGMPSSSQTS